MAVAVNEAAPIARFEFGAGRLRGSELVLYRSSLVHRGGVELETLQIAAIAALRVAFSRDERRLVWGVVLVLGAMLFLFISNPLAAWFGQQAVEQATGVGRALAGLLRALEAIASSLPVVALVCALGGAFLIVRGWQGSTKLTLSFGAFERSYAARGRDPLLLDFADRLSARLMSPDR